MPCRRELLHAREIRGGVQAQELVPLGRPGARLGELLAQPADLDEAADAPYALGGLGVRAGLHECTRRYDRGGGAGVVPQHALVEDEASPAHRVLLLGVHAGGLPGSSPGALPRSCRYFFAIQAAGIAPIATLRLSGST